MYKLRLKNGTYTTKVRYAIRYIFPALFVTIFIYLLSEGLVSLSNWSSVNGIQKPIVVMTNYNETLLTVIKQPIIYKREPLQVLSPFVASVMDKIDAENLTDIETKILEVFGVENFRVMRAVAKCESGMNPEAVNWSSRDIGLMQINYPTWKDAIKAEFNYTLVDLFDVDKNLEVAYWIFDRDGDGNGNINPWVATRTTCFADSL